MVSSLRLKYSFVSVDRALRDPEVVVGGQSGDPTGHAPGGPQETHPHKGGPAPPLGHEQLQRLRLLEEQVQGQALCTILSIEDVL